MSEKGQALHDSFDTLSVYVPLRTERSLLYLQAAMFIALVLAVGAIGVIIGGLMHEDRNIGPHLKSAGSLFKEKHYDQAIKEVAKAVESGEDTGRAHLILGHVYAALDDDVASVKHYARADKCGERLAGKYLGGCSCR